MKNYISLGVIMIFLVAAISAQTDSQYRDANEGTLMQLKLEPIDQIQAISAYGCDESIDLTFDVIPPDTYQASETILATGVVERGTVILRAGDEVTLDDGFEVESGAGLEVQIGDCIL